MSHADRPYLTRPLAGVDQAVGEGQARRPVELLDQLRERLDRLDPNHPSASQRNSDLDQAQPWEGQAGIPDRSSRQKASQDARPGGQPDDHGAGEPQAAGQPGRPAADNPAAVRNPAAGNTVAGNTVAGNTGNDLAADGQYRAVEWHRAGTGERYRPWFADEPGAPWFAEPGFTE